MPKTPVTAAKSALDSRLATVKPQPKSNEPLWRGPCAEGPLGGITFSMLSSFLSCRERFRVKYVEGIKPAERFNHRMDYGTMWHLCEEGLATNPDLLNDDDWVEDKLRPYCVGLTQKFPLDRVNIVHWYEVCRTQFPIYVRHWAQHDDVKKRTPLMQEQVFDVPYKLPSGRVVRLRGKFDSVDLIDGGVWLQENKTKGNVDIQQIQRQLTFDLQTMMYLIALEAMQESVDCEDAGIMSDELQAIFEVSQVKGVRYNVVRRPLSGGKGTIVRHKATKNKPEETWDSYYARVEQVIKDDPGHFFARWKTEILPADIARFRRECLDPILEHLCLWYDMVTDEEQPDPFFRSYLHWRTPFGVNFESLNDYGGDTDAYLDSHSMSGLRKVSTLFEELA